MLCHLYRRMTDVRDVNHGNMQSYYIVGYGTRVRSLLLRKSTPTFLCFLSVIPAVIVSLAVGLRTDAYGSDYLFV